MSFKKLSRSKLELYLNCPRCFYLDTVLGVGRPNGHPYNLNLAVDKLLKKEFDDYREKNLAHPWMVKRGLASKPWKDDRLDGWRNSFIGLKYQDLESQIELFGAVDDIWIDSTKRLEVVDYKATSRDKGIVIESDNYQPYRRQLQIYQWLLEKQDLAVSPTAYLLFCNAKTDGNFDSKLEFEVKIFSQTNDFSWVAKSLLEIRELWNESKIPSFKKECDYCQYLQKASDLGFGF